jgi:palmitoyltransferase
LDDSVKEVADVIIEIDDGLPDNNGDDESADEDVMLFIEYKYCTICHVEQPLRCKHCKNCDHCVATHDHHCPWIGNCVGERNRFYFFWFLQCQFVQLLTGLIICAEVNYMRPEEVEALNKENKVIMYMAFLICTAFTLFIMPLNIFHIYLASVNLTSWEYLSWMRITYLKIWPKKFGSPFSQGVKGNLKMYCCYNFRKKKVCH